jgi:hypothetical protein
MAYKLGGNAKIYYGHTNRTSWPSSGASAEIDGLIYHVGDVKLGLDKADEDSTTRDTIGFETSFATLVKASVGFKILYDNADTSYQALRNNFFNSAGPTMAIAVLDGLDTAIGTEGLWSDMQVFKFEKGEPVKGLQSVDVELKPALNTNYSGSNITPPQWIKVGTGPISV